MTKEEWGACALALATFYPHSFKADSPAQVKLWFEELKDLPGERVLASVKHMARTQPSFPSLADIRKHAEAPPIGWADAWAEVMKAVGSVGRDSLPSWSDPAIGRAVAALGGWVEVCNAPLRDHPTMRAQFRMAIETAAAEGRRDQTFQQLGVEPPKRLQPPKKLAELLDPTQDIKGLIGPGEDKPDAEDQALQT